MNTAALVVVPSVTWKSVVLPVLLNTWPGRRPSGYRHLERLREWATVDVAAIHLAQVAMIGGNPEPPAGWTQGDAPGVEQRRIGDRGNAGLIGDQVGGQKSGAWVATVFEWANVELNRRTRHGRIPQ